MNKRQKKKYIRKWVNTSGMFITSKHLVYRRIRDYYKFQKFMNKNVNRKERLWQSI